MGLGSENGLIDPTDQFIVDGIGALLSIDDLETVGFLHAHEGLFHAFLIFYETVEDVAAQADIHATLPIVQGFVFG